jgi:hypothetical protein
MRSVSMVTRMLSPNCGLSERSPDERSDIRVLALLPSQCSEKTEQRIFLLFIFDIIEDRIGPLSISRAAGAA